MAVRYTTIQEVRDACGVDSTLKTDAEITRSIEEVEFRLEAFYDTRFIPTLTVSQLDGTNDNRIKLERNPVLQVRKLKTSDQSVNPQGVDISEGSGYLYLNEDATVNRFPMKRNNTWVEYSYGWVEEKTSDSSPFDLVQTRLDGDYTLTSAAGDSSATITVDDGSIFTSGDYVRIYGVDGNRETTKVTGVSSNDLTLEFISQPHTDDSLVVKVGAPEWFKELVAIVAGIKVVGNIVGSQFDEITGYDIGDIRVQKGEPYTQWRETIIRLVEQRDDIMKRRSQRIHVS